MRTTKEEDVSLIHRQVDNWKKVKSIDPKEMLIHFADQLDGHKRLAKSKIGTPAHIHAVRRVRMLKHVVYMLSYMVRQQNEPRVPKETL